MCGTTRDVTNFFKVYFAVKRAVEAAKKEMDADVKLTEVKFILDGTERTVKYTD